MAGPPLPLGKIAVTSVTVQTAAAVVSVVFVPLPVAVPTSPVAVVGVFSDVLAVGAGVVPAVLPLFPEDVVSVAVGDAPAPDAVPVLLAVSEPPPPHAVNSRQRESAVILV